MAETQTREWPELGELTICVVQSIKSNGVYVRLEEFGERQGFIFIGEVASGWIKNIRSYVREGQRIVCKVTRVREDRESVDLSLKAVSEERRRTRIQQWKDQQKAQRLIDVVNERAGTNEAKEHVQILTEIFGNLHQAFEEIAINEQAFAEQDLSGDWIEHFHKVAFENIIPEQVIIDGFLELSSVAPNGVEAIRDVLEQVEELGDIEREITVTARYDGAPQYRVVVTAPDFETAENIWTNIEDTMSESIDGFTSKAIRA